MKALLKNRNYVLYWFATAVHMASSNIVQFMLSLYVLDITGSATLFATMLSITILPRLIFSPLAGVLGDRIDRRKGLIIFSICYTITLAFFGLAFFIVDTPLIWAVFILVILMEIFEIFYNSCAIGMISFIVPKEEIASATTASNFDEGIINVGGPILAAFLYGNFEMGSGILIAAFISFLAIFLLIAMKITSHDGTETNKEKSSFKKDIVDGLQLMKESKVVMKIIILAPLINFFLTPLFNVSLTYILREELNASDYLFANYYSLLAVVSIIAPFIGFKIMKKREPITMLSSSLLILLAGFVVMTVGNILSHMNIIQNVATFAILFAGSVICIVIVIIMNIIVSVLFQQLIPKNFYSRVGAFCGILCTISIPIGQMLYGSLLDVIPTFYTFLVSITGTFIIYFLSKSMLKNAAEEHKKASIINNVEETNRELAEGKVDQLPIDIKEELRINLSEELHEEISEELIIELPEQIPEDINLELASTENN